jgi:arylsulfatase A-like enzyme
MRAPLVVLRTFLVLAAATVVVHTASFSGAADGVINLPMALPIAKAPMPPGVVEDAPIRTFRVGRESRAARPVAGPQTIRHIVTVPAGGARFETVIAPLTDSASLDVLVDGVKAATTVAAPGAWTPVLVELPVDRGPVTIEERLDAARDAVVLWGDDRIAPAAASGRPDVLLITLDTTRRDYLTPYAPQETTTPTLARLAQEGTRFDQAISVSSWTLPAHAALMTGQFPDIDLRFGKRLEPAQVTLAEIFAAAGYTTHGASGGPYTDSTFGLQQGFRSYLDSAEWKNATSITDWAVGRVTAAKRGAPLFLFLNYFDAHEPGGGLTSAQWQALDAGKAPLTPAVIARIRAGYRDDLRRIDTQLSRLFTAMRRSRDWQNTLVVVAADHGQLLGEGGFIGHNLTLEENLIRVPLIVKPAVSAPMRRAVYAEQIQLTDVFDLTLQLAGLTSGAATSLPRQIATGEPLRMEAYAQVRVDATPALKALPRFRSSRISAIRTDSAKVLLDEEGRSTALRVSGRQETPMRVTDRLPQLLLADLRRFLHDQPLATANGSLELPPDVLERLRALGYIR